MRRALAAFLLSGLFALPLSLSVRGQPVPAGEQRFDGSWAVVMTCQQTADGASGFVYQFTAEVKNGMLHGEYGRLGKPASLTLVGKLEPDGNALLQAHGLTGNPGYSVGRVAGSTPFAYHVKAHFEASHGTGTRIEVRPCDYDFKKL
jgi:hypothetical protein